MILLQLTDYNDSLMCQFFLLISMHFIMACLNVFNYLCHSVQMN